VPGPSAVSWRCPHSPPHSRGTEGGGEGRVGSGIGRSQVRFLISRTRDDDDDDNDKDPPFPPREISFPNAAWFLPFLQKLVPLYGSLSAGNPPSRLPHSMPAIYPRRWGEKVDQSRREEPHPGERSLYPVYLSAFIRRQCAAHRSGPPSPSLPPLSLSLARSPSLPLRPLRVAQTRNRLRPPLDPRDE
jgi:hypothetical protein